MKKKPNKTQFYIGLILALAGALFMFLDMFPSSTRITISIIGLILIATSKFRLIK